MSPRRSAIQHPDPGTELLFRSLCFPISSSRDQECINLLLRNQEPSPGAFSKGSKLMAVDQLPDGFRVHLKQFGCLGHGVEFNFHYRKQGFKNFPAYLWGHCSRQRYGHNSHFPRMGFQHSGHIINAKNIHVSKNETDLVTYLRWRRRILETRNGPRRII